MRIKPSTVAAGFAFAAVLTFGVGSNGIQIGTLASAQAMPHGVPQSMPQCVAAAAKMLSNPAIYAGPQYAKAVAAKLRAMKIDPKRAAAEACRAARGNPKTAVALGRSDVAAMLMGLRKPALAGKKPIRPIAKPVLTPLKKKAMSAALKQKLAMLKTQCAAVKAESSKIAMQAKAVKDPQAIAAVKARMLQAREVDVRCARIGQAMTMQAKALEGNQAVNKANGDVAIKELQAIQQKLAQKQNGPTAKDFQNYDQKTKELMNTLTQVMKTMHETNKGIIQNMR